MKIFANFKMVCVTRRKNLTFSSSSSLKLLSTKKNLSVGKKHAYLRFSKMLGNCGTPSKLSQKQKYRWKMFIEWLEMA